VELAEQVEPTVALYRYALGEAGISSTFTLEPDEPGVLVYPALYRSAALYAFVSELGMDTSVTLRQRGSAVALEIDLPAGRAALALLDRRDGQLLGRYGNVSERG